MLCPLSAKEFLSDFPELEKSASLSSEIQNGQKDRSADEATHIELP